MRIKATQENLNKALGIVSRVAATRSSTLPILANILVEAKNNRITLSSTNLEIAIHYSIGGKVEKEGSITVPARLMNDFISSLPNENIDILQEESSLIIKSGSYESTINGAGPEDFPSLPKISEKTMQSIATDKLKKALQQCVFAASGDEARQVLTGVYLHSFEGALYMVATDSYRLAEKKISASKEEVSVIVPASAMQDLLRIINDGENDHVDMYFDESQIKFVYGEVELISRLIDGQFPDYRQLIPKKGDTELSVSRDDFINITKVSSLFARESAGSITLKVSEADQEISIRAVASQVGENTSRATAKVVGDGEVTLNSRFLLDALNAFDGDVVDFHFSGKINPCVIGSKDSKDYLHIVMPLRS